jgi:glutathione peroxidase
METKGHAMNVHDFQVLQMEGKELSLSSYKGIVLLIVNTATRCGFTVQYEQLEKLYEKYHERGFEILDFPCNQFKQQAPEEIHEIDSFCKLTFGTTFPRFAKVEVNGESAAPLYKYLKQQKGFAGFDPKHEKTESLIARMREADPHYEEDPSIKWNFTKFLIDINGEVVARFEPTADLAQISLAIEKLL